MYKKSPQGWLKHWDFILLDIFCLQLAFVVAYLVRQGLENPYSDQVYRTVAFVFMLCQIVVMFLGQSYQDILKRGYYIEFTKTAKHVLMVMLLSVLYLFATQQAVSYSRLTLFYTAFLYLCFDYVGRVWHKEYVLKKNAGFEEKFGRGMDFLAKYTMPIFLMHTLFAAPLRSVLLKMGITNAAVHIVLGLSISFAGPIIAAWIMKKTKWLVFFLYPNKFIRKVS